MESRTSAYLGLFHEIAPGAGPAVGREVAVSQSLLALGRHAKHHDIGVFCDPRAVRELAVQLAPEPRLRVASRRSLLEPGAFEPDVWHESQFETYRPFALRERLGRPFPVTLVHHTISYPHLLHDTILRLLLADTRPYDALLCASAAARDALRNLLERVGERFAAAYGVRRSFAGRMEVLPLGVDTERFRPLGPSAGREQFGLPPDAFVLLWVGRLSLVDKADLLPLVQTLAGLRRRNPDRNVMLVCAGGDRPGERFGGVIRQLAQAEGVGPSVRVLDDRAVFEPWLPHLYSAADVFVSPVDNVQETFGITPLEAMACGVPQVVSDWNGYRDTVIPGETGFLVPTRWARCTEDIEWTSFLGDPAYDHLALASSVAVDMDVLARSVQQLLDDPELRSRMGAQSRTRAQTVYAWDRIVGRYEALWVELAEEAGASGSAPPRPPGYAEPAYGDAFAGYASELLEEDARLRLTDSGRELRRTGNLPLPYNAEWSYLSTDLLGRILVGLERFDAKGEALSAGRILAVLARDDARLRAAALRHVMWLVKYGYVVPSRGPDSIQSQ